MNIPNAKHLVLGFDARSATSDWESRWPQERRNQFLLCDVHEQPRSVDQMVWPSLFEAWDNAWNRPFGLWQNLSELREALQHTRSLSDSPWVTIAVSVVCNEWDGREVEAWQRILYDPQNKVWLDFWEQHRPQPKTRQVSWHFLGYDVCDLGGTTSALMNCGYTDRERATFAQEVGPSLNDRHLFEALEPAISFKEAANVRVPEHAPFFVYGLWQIP